MPKVTIETVFTPLGVWLLAIPLGLGLLAVTTAALWFLHRSRGRRVVPADPADSDPLA